MKVYIVTPGETILYGFDPKLTNESYGPLKKICDKILAQLPKPPLIICGTGSRHRATGLFINECLDGTLATFSPFCGSGDYKGKDGLISTVDCRVKDHEYLGLEDKTALNPWTWIGGLPDDVLLCADEVFVSALDAGFEGKKGRLYEADADTRTVREIN